MTNGSNVEIKDLAKRTPEERTLVVRELAATSGRQAEDALMALASKEGDQAAMEVLKTLNPLEIGRIIKEHDFTIPSATAWLADPLKIADMLAMDPVEWQKFTLNTHEDDIAELQKEALSLLATILLTTEDEERQKQVLAALAENDNSFFYLCFPFIGQSAVLDLADSYIDWHADEGLDKEDENAELEKGVQSDSTYRQQLYDLYKLVDSLAPELALRMRNFINHQAEEMSPWEAVFNSIVELREEALAKIQSGDEELDEEEYENILEKEDEEE